MQKLLLLAAAVAATPAAAGSAPFLATNDVDAAGACSADDLATWKSKGKDQFQSYMIECGKKCWGAKACVSQCVASKMSYTSGCSDCFGGLGECTRDHCVSHCMANPGSDACKQCEDQYCVPTFKTCTGIDDVPQRANIFLQAFVEADVDAAAACSADDLNTWKTKGKDQFQSYMIECGKKCWGAKSCVSQCVASKMSYTSGCSDCFGGLGECTRDHCVSHCMANPGSDACKQCEDQYCVPTFKTCSGIDDVPQKQIVTLEGLELSDAAGKCKDASDTDIWVNKGGKAGFSHLVNDCGKKCVGRGSCVSGCVQKEAHYTGDCASCFGALGECTRKHCLNTCLFHSKSKCEACVSGSCMKNAGGFRDCTGFPFDNSESHLAAVFQRSLVAEVVAAEADRESVEDVYA